MVLSRKGLVLAALYVMLGNVCFSTAAEYTITDLGTLSGAGYYGSEAYGINASGQIVGLALYKSGRLDGNAAFIWQDGNMTNLNRGNMSYATGINASAQVVGAELGYGFLWQNFRFTGLGYAVPWAINDSGHIVGGNGPFNAPQAFFWQNGSFTQLGEGTAYAINNRDQIAGSSNSHAVLWQNGRIMDLGTLGGATSTAYGINASGAVVGISTLLGDQSNHAFLWQNGKMTDMGPGFAHAINDSGQVVGHGNMAAQALIWQNGIVTDLNTLIPPDSGWTLLDATAINDAAQIVGFGVHNNRRDAFLLTPSQAPVPEPFTLGLLSIGMLSVMTWGLSRHSR